MPKIKPTKPLASNKDYLQKIDDSEPEQLIDNQLQLAKFQVDVHNRLKKDIGADFVLAKLNEHQREVITEIIADAYLIKKQMTKIKAKSRQWKWDKKLQQWKETEYSQTRQEDMQKIIEATFDSVMVRVYSTVTLHRNIDKNKIIESLNGIIRREEEVQQTNGEKLKEGTVDMLQPEEMKQ